MLKLRMPHYVKLIHADPFPRTQVTSRLSGAADQYYGPFRTRSGAEQFEHEALNLFQIRRCQEELAPSIAHPGCIYGEMAMCLRPCQQVVGAEEYASEVRRVSEFLSSGGLTLLQVAKAARERLSEEMNFEEAARQHKRVERIEQVLSLRDELATDIDRLCGFAVAPAIEPGSVNMWPFSRGVWQPPIGFCVAQTNVSISLDQRLRSMVAQLCPPEPDTRERQEHLAILARWYYSSWRDGEWIPFESFQKLPYRRLVNSVSRVSHKGKAAN
jgi:hypothetical protein